MRSALALASMTAVAAPSIAPAALVPTPSDPIFAALDAFRRAEAEFYADRPEWEGDIPDKVGARWSRSIDVVIRTLPTTPAGLIALTSFARNMVERAKRDATFSERQRVSVMATIDDAARGMSGLDPWSPPVISRATDPIFAAIEAHGRAMAACSAAVDISANLADGTPEHDAAAAVTDRASTVLDEAGIDLADIEPTTTAGLIAMLHHVTELMDGDEFDGSNWRLPYLVPCDDGSEGHFVHRLLCSIAHTIQNLTAAEKIGGRA